MKAYYINLDRATDRRQHMEQQFSRLGMVVERVPAVDGNRLDVAAEAALTPPTGCGLRISAGAFGCFQSHREAWRRLVDSGVSHGLILEDDLLLADGLSVYLEDGWVPADADLVRLETFRTRTHVDKYPDYVVRSRHLRRLRSSHLGNGCYVVSAKAAHRLYNRTAVISEPVDVVLFSETSELFTDLVTYQMVPAPAVQGKRLGQETEAASWSVSTIPERFAKETPEHALRAESPIQRLKRRLSESLRARRRGTRYIVVPFG